MPPFFVGVLEWISVCAAAAQEISLAAKSNVWLLLGHWHGGAQWWCCGGYSSHWKDSGFMGKAKRLPRHVRRSSSLERRFMIFSVQKHWKFNLPKHARPSYRQHSETVRPWSMGTALARGCNSRGLATVSRQDTGSNQQSNAFWAFSCSKRVQMLRLHIGVIRPLHIHVGTRGFDLGMIPSSCSALAWPRNLASRAFVVPPFAFVFLSELECCWMWFSIARGLSETGKLELT